MNEESKRSILIGSFENIVTLGEGSWTKSSVGYTPNQKGRLHAYAKNPVEQYCMAKQGENKCNFLQCRCSFEQK